MHGAGAPPLAPVALGHRRRRRRQGASRRGYGRGAGAATSTGDGVAPARIDELVESSHRKITDAPAVVLGCLTWDGLDRYPDETRQRAEWGMALLSLGAAVENFMVAAADAGYASCWVAAPIFCPEAARDALTLDPGVAPPRDGRRRCSRPRLRRTTPPAGSRGRPPLLSVIAGVERGALTVRPTTPSVACGTCWNRTSEDIRVEIGAPGRAAHLRRTARGRGGRRRRVRP